MVALFRQKGLGDASPTQWVCFAKTLSLISTSGWLCFAKSWPIHLLRPLLLFQSTKRHRDALLHRQGAARARSEKSCTRRRHPHTSRKSSVQVAQRHVLQQDRVRGVDGDQDVAAHLGAGGLDGGEPGEEVV